MRFRPCSGFRGGRASLKPAFLSCLVLFVILARTSEAVIKSWSLNSTAGKDSSTNDDGDNGHNSTNDTLGRTSKSARGLTESMEEAYRNFQHAEETRGRKNRDYWARTFREIRNLAVPLAKQGANGKTEGAGGGGSSGYFNQWKLFSRSNGRGTERGTSTATTGTEDGQPKAHGSTAHDGDPLIGRRRRFEGFLSWERLLQEWADEVQDYLEKTQAETGGQYPMSTFGFQASTSTDGEDALTADARESSSTMGAVNASSSSAGIATVPSLPIPSPAKPGQPVLPYTDISDASKRIWIVTTASLPWRTGTAVNPLLRAAYLTPGRAAAGGSVTLMLPWLERQWDQEKIYGANNTFASPKQQEAFIRTWLLDSAGMKQASEDLDIQWYTAWHNPAENSIYSMGDITALIPADAVDICILEEPEHLNWYRAPGDSWTQKFKHVVGILHTNYFRYAMDQPAALIRAPGMRLLCSWMCRAHCHRVIKLSGTLDPVAPEKELVENVHGVRGTFIDIGEELRRKLQSPFTASDPVFGADAEPTVYFLGKLLWSKGLGSLMELLKYTEESAGLRVTVDMYGGGPDKDAANDKAVSLGLDMVFHGPLDHAEIAWTHKVFVNPSTSEVLCTASAEALAMGKFVILPSHPSNDFFAQFPNCLTYATKEEFVGNLYYALTHSPEPLSKESAFALSWKAATERLEAAACIPVKEAERMAEVLESEDSSIEITLPPLVEKEEDRKAIAKTFQYPRTLYRQFRTKLARDIQQSKVLPTPLRDNLANELEKRLDLDFEEMLRSPKLRLKLSPAELDKSLLELYNKISESPPGDTLRVIGGAGSVGFQNLYMKRQAQKRRQRRRTFVPSFIDEAYVEGKGTSASQSVRWVLNRNLQKSSISQEETPTSDLRPDASTNRQTPRMCLRVSDTCSSPVRCRSWVGLARPSLCRRLSPPKRPLSFSLLI